MLALCLEMVTVLRTTTRLKLGVVSDNVCSHVLVTPMDSVSEAARVNVKLWTVFCTVQKSTSVLWCFQALISFTASFRSFFRATSLMSSSSEAILVKEVLVSCSVDFASEHCQNICEHVASVPAHTRNNSNA